MNDHQKLRAHAWMQFAAAAPYLTPPTSAATIADQLLVEFDKRFPSGKCAHIFHSPSRYCSRCGEQMSTSMEKQLYDVESPGKL